MTRSFDDSPQPYVRAAGLLYLVIILLGLFGEAVVRGSLVVPGDAAATMNAIAASQSLWRAGIAGDLLMHVFDVPVIVVLYLLLRRVDKPLALIATFANIVQTAVLALNKLNLLVPLFLLGDAGYLKVIPPQEMQAMGMIAINAHAHGFAIGLVFFGFACLVRGWLVFRCGFLPKALGVLIAVAGLCYLANSFALVLASALAAAMFPAVLIPAFVGELALCLWLLFKGVDLERFGALRRA